ncbi:relA-associated inhibitor isoform X2 [Podarcis raffonei]|uniref:relA-associated inhibitor isoform X2 n=1 Tax=Podarcis raffonei TaxID=65483 RepID=UPI00232955AA|nr:relA-associated inhibitor isoform X2 [Podarcis raffonei]
MQQEPLRSCPTCWTAKGSRGGRRQRAGSPTCSREEAWGARRRRRRRISPRKSPDGGGGGGRSPPGRSTSSARSAPALASKHMDLKQLELDTAVAKVDELSKQLESLWTENPAQPLGQLKAMERFSTSPSHELLGRMSPIAPSPLPLFPRKSLSTETTESAHYSFGEAAPGFAHSSTYGSPSPSQLLAPRSPLGRPTSPRPSLFLQPEVDRALPPPRPKVLPVPYETAPSPTASPRSLRPSLSLERQYDYKTYGGTLGRASSPRMPTEGAAPQSFFPDRVPSPRPPLPPPYESHSLYPSPPSTFAPFRSQGGDAHMGLRQSPAGVPLSPWRESSLDGGIGPSKEEHYGMHSATLPRNYKVSPLASERRPDTSFRRSLPSNPTGTLPRNWQPISRIPMPPPNPQGSLPKRHKPLPLSMIFRLQNAFWEYGAAGQKFPLPQGPPGSSLFLRSLHKQLMQPTLPQSQHHLRMASLGSEGNGVAKAASPPSEPIRIVPIVLTTGDTEAELENLLPGGEPAEAEEVPRPLSPTRLQPLLPPEAQKVPEFEEVARVLAEMPRPLKRRGSMEQCPGPALPPTHKNQYRQIISRLFHHNPRKEDAGMAGEASPQTELSPITEAMEQKAPAAVVAPIPAAPLPPMPAPPIPPPPLPESPVSFSPLPSPEKRSVLRKAASPRKRLSKRARLNPLVLLLDAALTGELEVVKEAMKELNDPSQPNDEGITALHNAICGANYNIVDYLINIGANVNSPDSHGWTPLHCAASCNDTAICVALVKHGAAIFATTFSDGSMAIEKCDPYREGYSDCFSYLADVEQNMGLMNNGVVYALWDYSAEFSDELSFREGEPITVLRHDNPDETDWWWASLYGQEGYVPKNYFGLFPRVRPQQRKA